MGVLAGHVPSIEQLRPGLIEVIEESGGSKQFFRTLPRSAHEKRRKEQASVVWLQLGHKITCSGKES